MIHWQTFLTELPPWQSAGLKMTALLAAAWLVHFALVRANPRWRVLLWRGVVIGLVFLPLAEWIGPKLEVAILTPAPVVEPVSLPQAPTATTTDLLPPNPGFVPPPAPVPNLEILPPTLSIREWIGAHLWQIASGLWLCVACVLSVLWLLRAAKLKRFLRETEPAPEPLIRLLEKVRSELGCRKRVALRLTPENISPFLAGNRRPTIVIPHRMTEERNARDLPSVFAHELAHLASNDPFWTSALKGVSILLWFHPLAWRMRSAHAAACEQVCDAVAANYTGDASAYSQTLARAALEILVDSPAASGLPMIRTAEITRRLRNLKRGIRWGALSKKAFVSVLLVAGCLIGLIGSVKLVNAETATDSATSKSRTETLLSSPSAVEESDEKNDPQDSGAVQGRAWIGEQTLEASRTTVARVVHFPEHRSMGTLLTREAGSSDEEDWSDLGPAHGAVSVPAGVDLLLRTGKESLEGLAPLAELGTDDLQGIDLSTPQDFDEFKFGITHPLSPEEFVHLRGLTGLKELNLSRTGIDDGSLRTLTPLISLKKLILSQNVITDDGLRNLHGFRNLQILHLTNAGVNGTGLSHLVHLRHLRELNLGWCPVHDDDLSSLSELEHLERLFLYGTWITDKAFAQIGKLTRLEELNVSNASRVTMPKTPAMEELRITGEGFVHLMDLRSLRILWVAKCDITDEYLQYLTPLKSLEGLSLDSTLITDAGLADIGDITSLKHLRLDNTSISDEGLEHIGHLTQLRILNLNETKITDAGLVHLSRLRSLEHLSLEKTSISGEGLRHLSGLASLQQLVLDGSPITDSALFHLRGLSNLRILRLIRTEVTKEGIEVLKRYLPSDCEIYLPSGEKVRSMKGQENEESGLRRLGSTIPVQTGALEGQVWNPSAPPSRVYDASTGKPVTSDNLDIRPFTRTGSESLADSTSTSISDPYWKERMEGRLRLAGVTEVQGSTDESAVLLETIRTAYAKQRALFRNMRFKSKWTSPPKVIFPSHLGPMSAPETILSQLMEAVNSQGIAEQEFLLDSNGRYFLSHANNSHFLFQNETKTTVPPLHYSFDGLTYRRLYQNLAWIYSTDIPPSITWPGIVPTAFMDHLFNSEYLQALEKKESVFVSDEDDYWKIAFHTPESGKDYHVWVDPDKDFLVRKMVVTWPGGQPLEKEVDYEETQEGFWRPSRANAYLDSKFPIVVEIEEFELNGKQGTYTLEFPNGAMITDYSKSLDVPDIYYRGETRKAYSEIVAGASSYIAGVVEDENGNPVTGAKVSVENRKLDETRVGRPVYQRSDEFFRLNAWSDETGRFAIAFAETGNYGLKVESDRYAEVQIADVAVGIDDLKVQLPHLGTVKGRVVRMREGTQVPVPNAIVELERIEFDPYALSEIRRSQRTNTNQNGEFRFDGVRTYKLIGFESDRHPRQRKVSCEGVEEYVVFRSGDAQKEVELVLQSSTEGGHEEHAASPRLEVRFIAHDDEAKVAQLVPYRFPTHQNGYVVAVLDETLLTEADLTLSGVEPHGSPSKNILVAKVKEDSKNAIQKHLDGDPDRHWIAIIFDGQVIAHGNRDDYIHHLPQGDALILSRLSNADGEKIASAIEEGIPQVVDSSVAKDFFELVRNGDIGSVRELLTRNPGLLKAKDASGQTPLILAAREGHKEIVEFLLEAGAEVDARDNQGKNAWYYAAFNHHNSIANLLRQHGATWQSDERTIEPDREVITPSVE